ncbi:MAG: hypothetical protein IMF11_08925 [Proteobacteria bacterium]|nr:hypothetical protein [Pseudomonadota bacterium]
MSDYKVLHITHEVSLSVPDADVLAALELARENDMKIKKLLEASLIDGGKEIRLPINYGPGGRKRFEGIISTRT